MKSIEWDPNKHSCCRGLLMNYNFETSGLPEHANFYLTGSMDSPPAGVDIDDIADSARVNGQTLTCLGVYDQHHEFDFSARESVPRVFNIPISGDSSGLLHLEFWMNEALEALPDDTLLVQDGKLPRGFSKLAVTFVDVPDLHGRGFTRNKTKGRPCFKVHGTIRLEKREESLHVVVTLFRARHSWCKLCKDAHRAVRNCQHELNVSQPSDVLWTLEEGVWHPDRGTLVETAMDGYEADSLVSETDSGRRKRKRSATVAQTGPIRRSARHLSASELFMPRDEIEDAPHRSVSPLVITSPPPQASISSNLHTPPRTNSDIRPTLRGNKARSSASREPDHTLRHQGRRRAQVFARRTPSPAPIS
ncbi:hypothetical protein B0A48_03872 [Cryoendolithus antarcticus]|uniref:Uncharacterized protein n=1 Tax=Cryoendolithus antarcticus TaxID=1507870 RepID=A0A1V8TH13_9PEZI|nr:hypothetical protein B0A48_03872 [Cryoendolithus antarcticus]